MATNKLDMRDALENLTEIGIETVAKMHVVAAVLRDIGGHTALADHVQSYAELLAEDALYAQTVLHHCDGTVTTYVEVGGP